MLFRDLFATLALSLMTSTAFSAPAKIKVGSSPVISSAGIYLADAKGFFKEQNLDVEVIDVANSGAPMTLLLAKGELDVGGGNLTSGLFSAVAEGKDVKLVADKGHLSKDADYIVLLVRKDHVDSGRFKTLKDLKGFKMGLTALDGVSQQILADKFLAKAGLSDKDVSFVKLSYAEMNAALKSKDIDATIQLEPFVAQAEIAGFAKVVARGSDVYPTQQSAALLFSPSFLKNRDQAVKFMTAYLKGVRLYNRSVNDKKIAADVGAILQKRLKIDPAVYDKMTPVGLTNDGALDVKSLDADLNWYLTKGYLKTELKAASVVDDTIAKDAVKRLDGKK